jgi:toxin secretion/phage lysis holin
MEIVRNLALFSTKREGEVATILGLVGSFVVSLFGGFDIGMYILFGFMAFDWLTGIILAGVFKKSTKTEGGALSSKAGQIGLLRKGLTLGVVIMAHCFDLLIGQGNYFRDGALLAFIVNESVSILENLGAMNVWIPPIIKKAIEILKDKTDAEDKDETDS